MYVKIYTYLPTRIYTCIDAYMCICIYICILVHTHTHTYTHTHLHIHIHSRSFSFTHTHYVDILCDILCGSLFELYMITSLFCVYVCVFVSMCVYLCLCVCICVNSFFVSRLYCHPIIVHVLYICVPRLVYTCHMTHVHGTHVVYMFGRTHWYVSDACVYIFVVFTCGVTRSYAKHRSRDSTYVVYMCGMTRSYVSHGLCAWLVRKCDMMHVQESCRTYEQAMLQIEMLQNCPQPLTHCNTPLTHCNTHCSTLVTWRICRDYKCRCRNMVHRPQNTANTLQHTATHVWHTALAGITSADAATRSPTVLRSVSSAVREREAQSQTIERDKDRRREQATEKVGESTQLGNRAGQQERTRARVCPIKQASKRVSERASERARGPASKRERERERKMPCEWIVFQQ